MWIYSQERGLFNLDKVSRITFDEWGTYFAMDGVTIVVCNYDASERIAQAIKNNVMYMEV